VKGWNAKRNCRFQGFRYEVEQREIDPLEGRAAQEKNPTSVQQRTDYLRQHRQEQASLDTKSSVHLDAWRNLPLSSLGY
jgi:hypothetical protein